MANEIISLEGAGDTTDIDIAYDAAGNMTTMPRLPMPGYAPGRLLCQYDAWGRLTAVYEDTGSVAGELDSPGDTLLAEYQYDGRGRRTAKIVREGSGDTWRRTDYYYDESWRVVEERATAGAVSYASAMSAGTVAGEAARAQYLYDPGRGDTPICRFRDADGNDETGPGGLEEALFYTSDANGNVTALVRPDGTVVERYMYDAYGQAHVLNGSAASGADPDGADGLGMAEWTLDPDNVSDWDNEVLFSGYRRDGETGLYQARTRYYDCILGTFISRDPAGFVDGMNLMQYCGGNPINATDPTGLAMIDSPVQAGPTDYINPAVFDYSPPRAPYSGFGIPMDAVGGAGYADLLGAPLTLVGTEGLLTGPLLSDASAAFSVGPFSGRQINAWLGDPVTVYASCNSAFEEAIAVYRHRQMNIARYLMLVSGFSQWDWISAPSGFWDCDDPLRARELEVVRTDLREGYWHRVYSPDAQQGLVLCNIPNHIDTEDDPKLRISGIGLIISGIVGKDGLTGERLTPLQAGVNAGEGTLTFLSWVWLGKWLLSRPEMVCARAPAISGYGQRIVSAEEWSVAGQETTIFANEMLGMNPGMASKYMTKAQYAAGLSDARVAAANRGIAVENYVAREMAMSPRYGAYTRHLGGAYRPDFIMLQNRDWVISDITTNAAVSGHLGRWYGPQSTYWTYDTPQTFTVFPPP